LVWKFYDANCQPDSASNSANIRMRGRSGTCSVHESYSNNQQHLRWAVYGNGNFGSRTYQHGIDGTGVDRAVLYTEKNCRVVDCQILWQLQFGKQKSRNLVLLFCFQPKIPWPLLQKTPQKRFFRVTPRPDGGLNYRVGEHAPA